MKALLPYYTRELGIAALSVKTLSPAARKFVQAIEESVPVFSKKYAVANTDAVLLHNKSCVFSALCLSTKLSVRKILV